MKPLLVRDARVRLGTALVLDGVSLEVKDREFLALLGPNGGGKTTLLKAALGLVPLEGGRIELLGEGPAEGRRRVGYLPQRKAWSPTFPARAVDLIVAARRGGWPVRVSQNEREAAHAVLRQVGGEHLLDRPLHGLSGGEVQRVFLARALVNSPLLLLLDEPTAGVDARGRAEFLDVLEAVAGAGALAAVLVTHNLAAVHRLADRVAYLDHRILAEGPPDAVLADADLPRSFAGHDHDERGALCEDD
jgi:ABC-type Mn2+/Zn2+ transport system ATPase subunit